MGGEGHDGAYLTDTIILAGLKPSTQQIALLSIPRDLSVPTENHGWQKINSINAFAEQKKDNSGGLATTETISQLLNLPIPYYVRVDFKGFINIVNDFGGLDLYVDNTLDDYQYPIMGREDSLPISRRTEHLHINQGWQHMNGELALKYVRSRHAAGAEGSDFARSRRQQKILAAFKEKVFSWKTILSPKKIKSLLDNYRDHFSTNLNLVETMRFSEILKEFDLKNLANSKNLVLDDSPGGYLYATASDTGGYILLPRNGDFSDLQQLAENIFSLESPKSTSLTKPLPITNRTSLEILNGTKLEGFASQTKDILENLGYKVVKVGNAQEQDYTKTIIYDLTNSQKPEALNILQEKLNANTSTNLPDWYLKDQSVNPHQKIDFLILLGTKSYTADDYL
jgi:LCP family protein required for cell wall assembly